MKRLLALLLFLSTMSTVHAELEMVEVPSGAVSSLDTVIYAKIENVGFDRIFVALPTGWTLIDAGTAAWSYPVLETGLWRKYGDPFNSLSLLGSGKVYQPFSGLGRDTKQYDTLSSRTGWWLKPNEGVDLQLQIDSFPCSGTIDPTAIEDENPYIIVREWEQDFTITPSSNGFITATCVVDGAALTSASPAAVSDVSQPISTTYYSEYVPTEDTTQVDLGDVPSWDSWFTLTGSLSGVVSTKSIVGMEPVYSKMEAEIENIVITQTPVWRIENLNDITYTYHWKRGETISGINLIQSTQGPTYADVPEWFDWF